MGMDPEANLAYGYDLGSLEDFKAVQRGEYGSPDLPWFGEAEEDDEEEGFPDLAEKILMTSAGFTEDDYRVDGYFDRKRAAEDRVGVEIDHAGSYDYSGYLLVAKGSKRSVEWAETMILDPAEIVLARPEWDAKLTAALAALGITPTQDGPRWLVFPFYG